MSNEISRDDLWKAVALVVASNLKISQNRLQLVAMMLYEEIRKDEFWSRSSQQLVEDAARSRSKPRRRPGGASELKT
jgi:hypothetical protein